MGDTQTMHSGVDKKPESDAKSHFSSQSLQGPPPPYRGLGVGGRRRPSPPPSAGQAETEPTTQCGAGGDRTHHPVHGRRPAARPLRRPAARATQPGSLPPTQGRRTPGSRVRVHSEWHFLVAEQAQVISQPHQRIPKARITSRELHLPLGPWAPAGCEAAAGGSGWGKGAGWGGGAARPPPTAQTWLGILRPPQVVAHARPTRQRPAGRPRTPCPPRGGSRRLPLARRPRPAGPLQSKKGPAPSLLPAARRAAPRRAGPPPHLHTARPPRSTARPGATRPPRLHVPAHLICISLWSA